MKWFKLFLSIFCLFIVVIIFALGIFVYFADAEKFKSELINEVQSKTGYQLVIDGRMSFSFFPRLAVYIDRMMVKAPQSSGYFLDARQVKVAADLFSWIGTKQKLKGKVSATRMRLMNMNFDEATCDLHFQSGVLTIAPIKAQFYQGQLEGNLKGQNFFVMPNWQLEFRLKDVELQSLLRDVNDGDIKLNVQGLGNLHLQAETFGKTRSEMMNQLNGIGDFNVPNGTLEGFDLKYYIKSAEALIRNDPDLQQTLNEHRTPFTKLNGSFIINHGQAETNNLLLISPLLTVKALGHIELMNRLLDFKLNLKSTQNEQSKWYIPILLTGTLSHPEMKLDTKEISQMLAGEEIDKIKQKALDQIDKHVHGKAGDFLKKLLR